MKRLVTLLLLCCIAALSLKGQDIPGAKLMDEAAGWDGDFPLRVYAVSVDDSRSLQRAIAMSKAWEGVTPLFDPNGDLRRALNVSAVPQIFVYDKDGNLYHTHIGYRPGDELQLLDTLRKCADK